MAFAVWRSLDASLDAVIENLTAFGPIMVFSGTLILFTASIVTVVAFIIYRALTVNASLGLSQSLTLVSSIVSLVFAGLYLLAARQNEPIGKPRPPILPLHNACVVFVRFAIFLWVVAATVTLVIIASGVGCVSVGQSCAMQRLDMAMSILAILAAITTSCGLENCDEPFKTPNTLNIRPMVVCRVSYFDDILERSISRSSSRSSSFDDIEKASVEKSPQASDKQIQRIKRKPTSESVARLSQNQPCASSVLIGPLASDTSVWHSGPPGLLNETGCDSITSTSSHADDTASLYTALTQPSSESMYSGKSVPFSDKSSETSQELTLPHITRKEVAAPSSSIGSSSHRSPLSTMRNIDDPDVAIQPVLHFFPLPQTPSVRGPNFSSGHDCNNAAITSPINAYIKSVQRHSFAMVRPLALKKKSVTPGPFREDDLRKVRRVPRKASSYPELHSTEKRGAYNRHNGIGRYEDSLEAHTRAIEEAILAGHQLRAHQVQQAIVKVADSGEFGPQ